MKLKDCILPLLFLFAIVSCNNEVEKTKKQAAKIPVNLTIIRFETELYQDLNNNFNTIEKKYNPFLKLYCERILQIKDKNDSDKYKIDLKNYLNNKYIKGLYDTTMAHFGNLDNLKAEMQSAFQMHQFYFPKDKSPTIYTFNSEFGYGVVAQDSIVGIGLDMFLGEKYPYYQSPQINFPSYFIKQCVPQNITNNVMKAWGQQHLPNINNKMKLLDYMIMNGKMLYYQKAVMPDMADSILLNYSNQQLVWCGWNEFKIWEFFIKNNLLYKTDHFEIDKFITDAPVTSGMPPESPGNIGTWVGWQIVKKYMDKKNITLAQLLAEADAQKILTESNYKPTPSK